MARQTREKMKIRFGNRLRIIRERLNVSQEKLGFDSEIDRTYIVGIEGGQHSPTLYTVYKLADALGVPMADLMPDQALNR